MRRRTLLRATGAVTAGAVTLTSTSSASRRKTIDPATGEVIAYDYEYQAARDARRNGLSTDDTLQLDDGSWAVSTSSASQLAQYTEDQPHPDIGSYQYLGSLAVGRVCKWTTGSCVPLSLYVAYSPDPGTKATTVACATMSAGCYANDLAQEHVGCHFDYLHFYRPPWWHVVAYITGNPLLIVPSAGCQ